MCGINYDEQILMSYVSHHVHQNTHIHDVKYTGQPVRVDSGCVSMMTVYRAFEMRS